MPFPLRDVFTWVDEAYPDGVPPEDSGTLVGLLRHRIGAEQTCIHIVPENIDERAVVHRIDMLRIHMQTFFFQRSRNPLLHAAQSLDRGEQSKRATAGSFEQRPVCTRHLIHIVLTHIVDNENFRPRRIIERRFKFFLMDRWRQM